MNPTTQDAIAIRTLQRQVADLQEERDRLVERLAEVEGERDAMNDTVEDLGKILDQRDQLAKALADKDAKYLAAMKGLARAAGLDPETRFAEALLARLQQSGRLVAALEEERAWLIEPPDDAIIDRHFMLAFIDALLKEIT